MKSDLVNFSKSCQIPYLQNIFFKKIIMAFNIIFWVPKKLFKLWNYICISIDQFSIDRIKEFRLRKKFPLFLDFYLPARVKHIKLNGVTLPPVLHNGRIYIDDRFLKLGSNEIRIQYYSKVNMLSTGIQENSHRLIWNPKGIGLASLFPSLDQSLFNITLSFFSKILVFIKFIK